MFRLKNISEARVAVVIILFSLVYFLAFCRFGLDMDDEGFHLYVSSMILKGLVPYQDFVLHTSPGSYYMQALIFKLFSASVLVGRLSVVFLGVCISFTLFKLAAFIVKPLAFRVIPSILFVFWGVAHLRHPWYGWYGLASGLVFLYYFTKYVDSDKKRYLFLSGIFCAVTFLMKQNLGVACLTVGSIYIYRNTFF